MTSAKNKNMELWNQVFTTDIKYTKPASKGAYKFTSIAPMYQKMRITEALGPQGIAWGVEPESERFEYKEIGTTTLLTYFAIMFYKFGGETGRITLAATEKMAYMTQGANGYLKIDDEAHKKAKTAALSKGLSEIGVCADIHMGLHENYEYQEYASAKLRIESGDDEAIKEENDKFNEWLKKEVEAIALAPNPNAVSLIARRIDERAMDKLTIMKSSAEKKQAVQQRIQKAVNEAFDKLNTPKGQ